MNSLNFENPFFLILSITGAAVLLVGIVTKYFPPKEINAVYGYRSLRAMKNLDNWEFAQKHYPKQLIFAGLTMIAVSLTALFIPTFDYLFIAALVIMAAILILFSSRTEKALKEFDNRYS